MEKLNRWRKRKLHPTKFLTNLGQMWSLKLVGAIVWKNQRLHQRIIVTIEYYLDVNNLEEIHSKLNIKKKIQLQANAEKVK